MATSAIFFGCRQVCWHDHGGRDGVVELKSHPFCVLACVPAGWRVRQHELWFYFFEGDIVCQRWHGASMRHSRWHDRSRALF